MNLGRKPQLAAALPPHAGKENNTSALARSLLDLPASSPQIRGAADSLYYRQYAFLKVQSYEAQKLADVKDILSNHESRLERQGSQQFPERVVQHYDPGVYQRFLTGSQQAAWEVSMSAVSWQGEPRGAPLGVQADFAGHRLLVCWSMLLYTYLMQSPCPHTLGSQQAPSEE